MELPHSYQSSILLCIRPLRQPPGFLAFGKLGDHVRAPETRCHGLPTAAWLHWKGRGLAGEALLRHVHATNKSARASVSLLFLIRKSEKAKFNIPATFQALDTPVYTKPRKYQESQYKIQSTELRMEFYLHLFELFCRAEDTGYSVFNGTKILYTGLVSTNNTLISTVAILVLSLLSQTFGCSGRLELNLLCSVTSAQVELMSYVLSYFSSSRAEVIGFLSFQLDST